MRCERTDAHALGECENYLNTYEIREVVTYQVKARNANAAMAMFLDEPGPYTIAVDERKVWRIDEDERRLINPKAYEEAEVNG